MTLHNIDGRWYRRSGYYGCQLSCKENGIKKGDVRVILEHVMYAWVVKKNFFTKNEVLWSLVNPSKEDIDNFIAKVKNL